MAAAFRDALRSGSWITPERARFAAIASIVGTIAAMVLLAGSGHGSLGSAEAPLGTDFASFYAAGKAALAGVPAAPYDPASHHLREQLLFGPATPFYAWQYPPIFLLVAAPLASLPYLPALILWQSLSLILYLAAVLAIVRISGGRDRLGGSPTAGLPFLLALGFPAVFVNIGHGQNGFLSAALLGGGLSLLDRRPTAAGILFGCLAYKPQFGPMIAVALVAGGRWRALLGAVAAVAFLVVASSVAFGSDSWRAFFASLGFGRSVLLEAGAVDWHKFQTVFAALRMWGSSVTLAWSGQSLATMAAAGLLAWLWHRRAAYSAQAAALSLATILGSPFALDYDLVLLAPAIAFLALDYCARGEGRYQRSVLGLLWLVPLFARTVAGALYLPVGTLTVAAAFVVAIERGNRDVAPQSATEAPPTSIR
jgi:glycosyl transferase family 87